LLRYIGRFHRPQYKGGAGTIIFPCDFPGCSRTWIALELFLFLQFQKLTLDSFVLQPCICTTGKIASKVIGFEQPVITYRERGTVRLIMQNSNNQRLQLFTSSPETAIYCWAVELRTKKWTICWSLSVKPWKRLAARSASRVNASRRSRSWRGEFHQMS
jgi:hypothetical protein